MAWRTSGAWKKRSRILFDEYFMSDIAIRVDGVSKLYRLGEPERYRTLRDTLTDAITSHASALLQAQEVITIWPEPSMPKTPWHPPPESAISQSCPT